MRSIKRRITGAVATAAALSLGLAACSGGSGDSGDSGNSEDKGTISVGVAAGWPEGVAASYVWKAMLEERGYTVELQTGEIGTIFTSLAGDGGYDLLFDAWLPQTHKQYIEKYGDDITDLGVWYDQASLNIAVNKDAPIDSLSELAENADAFDNRIVGIDPGAGLTDAVKKKVIPEYGLEDMEFVISSTSSMLAELKSATESGENIVVTLWHPQWAYDAFPIRDLKDPKNTLGDAEKIHTFSSTSFPEEFPKVKDWIGNFKMSDDKLAELENLMFNKNGGEKNLESAKTWLKNNPDFEKSIFGDSAEGGSSEEASSES